MEIEKAAMASPSFDEALNKLQNLDREWDARIEAFKKVKVTVPATIEATLVECREREQAFAKLLEGIRRSSQVHALDLSM